MYSIVIPLYNKGISVRKSLQSALNQTIQDFEIVIVNDGSTDQSVEVVESFKDERIRIFHQENQGAASARNKGIREAKSDWIVFLDADDEWEPFHLEEIQKMQQQFSEEKIFMTSWVHSNHLPLSLPTEMPPIFKAENYFEACLKWDMICTPVLCIHRSCFEDTGYFNEHLRGGQDSEMWARLGRKGYAFVKSQRVTTLWNMDSENKTTKRKDIPFKETFEGNLDLKNSNGYERQLYKRRIISKAVYLAKNMRFREAFQFVWKYNIQIIL